MQPNSDFWKEFFNYTLPSDPSRKSVITIFDESINVKFNQICVEKVGICGAGQCNVVNKTRTAGRIRTAYAWLPPPPR